MHAAAEDRDAGLHCLPQKCRTGSECRPWCGFFCIPAQSGCGWILHQQDRDSVFGLYRERLSRGVSRASSSARGLKSSIKKRLSTKGRLQNNQQGLSPAGTVELSPGRSPGLPCSVEESRRDG